MVEDARSYMRVTKEHIKKTASKIVNISWAVCLIIVFLLTMQIFVFSSFRIPSESMAPELITGDRVIVNKLTVGARLFNFFATVRNEPTPIFRLPGFKKIERNDVLVFNSIYPNTWDKIEMHMMQFYIKRCIGLPGDTLSIQNGHYKIKGLDTPLGNLDSQNDISKRTKGSFEECVYTCYPFDSIYQWNIKDFGPLYVPKENDKIELNRMNYILYRKLIEWELQDGLVYRDSQVYLNNQPIKDYRFRTNYYFMGGDNVGNSQDSRYLGLIPEDFIVGKAWMILKSSDPYSGKIDWDRFFKIIH